MVRKATERWENIHISNTGLISRIYKGVSKCNSKNKNNNWVKKCADTKEF